MSTRWDRKFFESTRGRVVMLLRWGGYTVDKLAGELGLTNNGVRAHLATLERDGIVRQRGVVRSQSGGGKPAYIYELTPEAEDLFPKAYERVLDRLLDVLAEQLDPDESETLLRAVGRLIVEEQTVPTESTRAGLEAAVDVLNEWGGLAELEERAGGFVIRSYSCPLSGVTPDHPEVCDMVESLIAELAGMSVRENCDRDDWPRCCFEIAP